MKLSKNWPSAESATLGCHFLLRSCLIICAAFFLLWPCSSPGSLFLNHEGAVTLANSVVCPSNTPFTVEYWASSTNNVVYSVLGSDDGNGFSIRHDPYEFILRAGTVYATQNSGLLFATPAATFYIANNLEDGEWHHIAIVRDEDNVLQLYLDGDPVAGGQVWVGELRTDFLGGSLSGRIADVRIWNHERSSGQIELNRNRRLSGAEVGLMAYWPLNEQDGSVAHDLTPNENDGFVSDGGWVLDEDLELVANDADFVPSKPLLLANETTGSTGFTNTGRVEVVSFSVPSGLDRYQITLSSDPVNLNVEAWKDTALRPDYYDFEEPFSDTDLVFYAWFTNSAESVILRRATASIRYSRALPVPVAAASLRVKRAVLPYACYPRNWTEVLQEVSPTA